MKSVTANVTKNETANLAAQSDQGKFNEGANVRFNRTIVAKLKALVQEERRITTEILNYLAQVEKQKIFALMGYPSLFEFCTRELNYSEGAAHRRISAMRLIVELPEVKDKIVSGALSLSVVAQAQTFFRKKKQLCKPMIRQEKLDLIMQLENTSARQCEKKLVQLEPTLISKDKERYITNESIEIKITVDKDFISNLETLKNWLSHKIPFATTKDILALALKELVKKTDPTLSPPTAAIRKLPAIKDVQNAEPNEKINAPKANLTSSPPVSAVKFVPAPTSQPKNVNLSQPPPASAVDKLMSSVNGLQTPNRYIPSHTKRLVWRKYNGKCCYHDPLTSKRCNSQKFIEIDHIQPRSRGGSNDLKNLQLLCDVHNRLKGSS